ncbi:MAG: FAD:protein FMN transferase, partial [Phycisphaerales bacterium]|nr:FAD:protein FMN transferase [Phycisphaerales bacterium]
EQTVALAGPAMGTRFELLLRGPDRVALRSAGEAALEEIGLWHGLLNAFDPASVVSRVNREAAQRPVRIPPELAELLLWCEGVTDATGGAFDPSIGGLMRSAGFRDEPRCADDPADGERCVRLDHEDGAWRICLLGRGAALDFGAIGKGWALDRAAGVLRACGVRSALLHGGTSSIVTIGAGEAGQPWRIGVGDGGPIELVDEALGLSAPSGRVVEAGGGLANGHILDPRTGRSAVSLAGAMVTGPKAAVCDAWSTALVVDPALADSQRWPAGYRAMLSEQPGVWRACDGPWAGRGHRAVEEQPGSVY